MDNANVSANFVVKIAANPWPCPPPPFPYGHPQEVLVAVSLFTFLAQTFIRPQRWRASLVEFLPQPPSSTFGWLPASLPLD